MTGDESTAPDPASAVSELWSLRSDVLITSDAADGALTLVTPWGETAVRPAGPRLGGLLGRLQLGPTRLENALDTGRSPGTEATVERATLMFALERLQHLVVRSLATAGGSQVMLSVEPISRRAEFRPQPVDPARPIRLSSFAVLSRRDGVLQAESPLCLHRVLLHTPEAAMIASALAQPRSPDELAAMVAVPAPVVHAVASYLCAAGVVVQGGPTESGPEFAEDRDPVLRMWSGLDLMFHTRSTLGRHDGDFGATYPMGCVPCPEPAVKARDERGLIPLYRPAIEEILHVDAPFTAVFEARSSGKCFSPRPPTARELGELLYRALRIRSLITLDDGGPVDGGLSDRPYPGGGAMHELEFYISVQECEGLEPGVYAYDAVRHGLVPVGDSERARVALSRGAQIHTGLDRPPPLVIGITARFGRVLWKYSAMGYALIMKDTGVALMALQLVAVALRLAACPVGGVEIDESSRLLGLDWRAESSVAALVLGRAADPHTGCPPPDGSSVWHRVNDPEWQEIGARYVHGGR